MFEKFIIFLHTNASAIHPLNSSLVAHCSSKIFGSLSWLYIHYYASPPTLASQGKCTNKCCIGLNHPVREYLFHLTYKHHDFLLQSLHHRLWDILCTNLPIEVTEFSQDLPQIGIQISMKHYWHQSLDYNVVVMDLQPVEFTSADIHCSFYIRRIAVRKL
jgi:hypothetical protein